MRRFFGDSIPALVWFNGLKTMEARVHVDTYYWLIKTYDGR